MRAGGGKKLAQSSPKKIVESMVGKTDGGIPQMTRNPMEKTTKLMQLSARLVGAQDTNRCANTKSRVASKRKKE